MQIMKGNCEMDLNIYLNQFTDDIYPGRTPIYNPYWLCATVEGMVFNQIGIGYGIKTRQFWFRMRYH